MWEHQGLWRDLHCLTSGLHHLGRLTVYLPEMSSMHSHAANTTTATPAAAPTPSPDALPPLQPVVICDGQQRLITTLLLLAALRDAAEELCLPSASTFTSTSAAASTSTAQLSPSHNLSTEPLTRAAALRYQLVTRVHKALFNHPASARLWHRQLVRPVP